MNYQKDVAKHIFILTILFSLIINSVPQTFACGPDPITPVFSFNLRPDDNLKDFAAGDLGILKPNYARSYLIIAYRHLNGYPLTEKEQNEMVRLWNDRLGINWKEDENDKSENAPFQREKAIKNAIKEWFDLRNESMETGIARFSVNDLWRSEAEEFTYYQNCTKSALETATKTLRARLKKYGRTENITNWIKGQDAVFSNCSSNRDLPKAFDQDSPAWLKNDRNYQIAAAHFYRRNFDEARKKFITISENKTSEWSVISSYLVARTYFREASFDSKRSKELLKKAETRLLKILDDKELKDIHPISRKLLYVFANRLKTKERFHKFSELLSHKSTIPEIYNEVETYINYLDSFGFKKRDRVVVEKKEIEIEKKDLSIWEWIWSFFSNEIPKEKKIIEENKLVTDENYEDKSCYFWDEQKLKNSMHFCSEVTFKNISETSRSEDISDWIFTFQSNEKASYEHALKKWNETSKLHWFVAAIADAETDYDDIEELIEHAEKIDRSSPAFHTVKFHQIRLLLEQKKNDSARKKLDSFLKKSGNDMPTSTQNAFFGQRMLVAKNLGEFLHFSRRKAIAYARSLSYYDETPNIGKYGYYPGAHRELAWRKRWMFDEDAVDVINKQIPLSMLIKAGSNSNLPAYLQKSVLISAWTRAVLLDDLDSQKQTAKLLLKLAPEMSSELSNFYNKPNDLNRYYLLIKFPVLRPVVEYGFGRFTIPAKYLDSYRDNWWTNYQLTRENQYTDKPFSPTFLTAKRIKRAESEYEKIIEKGRAGNVLGKNVISVAKNYPKAKQIPEMLHKTVRAIRYSDSKDAGKYGKEAFQMLHKTYPRNYWTKKTKYWYSGSYY